MTIRNIFKIIAPLLLCLFFAGETALAQGWTSASNQTGGNPQPPYADDGNYVAAPTPVFGNKIYSVINHPDGVASYRFDLFTVGEGWRGGRSVTIPGNGNIFARDALVFAPDSLAVFDEEENLSATRRAISVKYYRVPYGPWSADDGWFGTTQIYDQPGHHAFAKTLLGLPSGDLLALGSVETEADPGNRDVLLTRISPTGNLLWLKVFAGNDSETPVELVPGANGIFYILKKVGPAGEPWLMSVDPNGNIINQLSLGANPGDLAVDMAGTADGNLVLIGRNQAGDLFLQKSAPDGSLLWRQDFATPDQTIAPEGLLENANGDLVAICNHTNLLTNEQDGFLMKFDASGNPVWERKIGRDNRPETMTKIRLSPDGGYILTGKYFSQVNNAYTVKTDVNGVIKAGRIFGNVFNDNDLECSNTPGDTPVQNWMVQAFKDSTHVFYGTADADGNYSIECDSGNYVLSLLTPNPYWQACANNLPIFVGYLDTANVDFAVQAAIDCPYMTVEHGMFNVRPCDTTYLSIDYCNTGTVTAIGAYVEVTLDSILSFVDASVQPTSVAGQVLTFPLGDVDVNACGHLTIWVGTSCTAQAGQTVCTDVHIFPDSICVPADPAWSGALIELGAVSEGDSVRFLLTNVGSAATSTLEYIVIEDALLLRTGSYQLSPGETMEIKEACNGRTWHLLAAQEPGAPGNNLEVAAIEGCLGATGGTASTGFFNQFSLGDSEPFYSNFCLPVTTSFDPNDKQAFPTGYGAEHNIFANTDIEYMIRFQNTGTDSAFRVVLLDSLSAFLDPTTFKPGASSHPYKFQISEKGVLKFTFQPIALPHSSVDEPGSNGFVTFRIGQRRDLPVGTRIENRAGIYFDYNLPVITNTVLHTISKPWIKLVNIEQPGSAPKIALKAFPNPFAEQVAVRIEGESLREARLQLFGTDGKLLREIPFQDNEARLERRNLPAGMYFFTIKSADGATLGFGRLVAE